MQAAAYNVEVLNSTQRVRWENIFEQIPPELRDINYSFDYNFLYERNGDGKIQLFLYREESSLFYYPFLLRPVRNEIIETGYQDIETVYGYTGPISTSTDVDFLERANQAFLSYCSSQKVVCEFIRFHPLLHNHAISTTDPELKVLPLRDYVYVDLLKTEAEIWNGYSSQNRNKIRKAEKHGVIIESGFNPTGYAEFVGMYLENMRQVHAAKMYFFSTPFFDGLSELLQKKGNFLLARNEKEMLGAAVFLGGTEIGHYFLAAATPEGKRLAAGNLLLHHGIHWSKRNGMNKLHLGGGVSAEADDPLLVFKNNFSRLTEKFYIGKRIHNKEIYLKLVDDWDRHFPEEAVKYKSILQRYRWNKEDLV